MSRELSKVLLRPIAQSACWAHYRPTIASLAREDFTLDKQVKNRRRELVRRARENFLVSRSAGSGRIATSNAAHRHGSADAARGCGRRDRDWRFLGPPPRCG